MTTLQLGSRGAEVKRWQLFLIGQKLLAGAADGIFGAATKDATRGLQSKYGLTPDGIAGNKTIGLAMTLGYSVVADPSTDTRRGADWPPKPGFQPLVSTADRQRVFGKFAYRHVPTRSNPESIEITDSWPAENIVRVRIPQLSAEKVANFPATCMVPFHRLAMKQLVDLFLSIEKAKLTDRILSWGGSYVPRLVRGSKTNLSNHAFGTAFDINVAWNPLGARPALFGKHGSVRELVTIANDHGFYWGGHFTRLDGMHFEVAQVR